MLNKKMFKALVCFNLTVVGCSFTGSAKASTFADRLADDINNNKINIDRIMNVNSIMEDRSEFDRFSKNYSVRDATIYRNLGEGNGTESRTFAYGYRNDFFPKKEEESIVSDGYMFWMDEGYGGHSVLLQFRDFRAKNINWHLSDSRKFVFNCRSMTLENSKIIVDSCGKVVLLNLGVQVEGGSERVFRKGGDVELPDGFEMDDDSEFVLKTLDI